uniref:Rieske domain-containing protein n=1 Tax=Leersia perrieri TaxID=77586 RepID=A0A0D9W0D1_9ORYZ
MAPLYLHLLPNASRPLPPLRHLNLAAGASATSLAPRHLQRMRADTRWSSMSMSADTMRPVVEAVPMAAGEEQFDWLDQWYPIAPVCDLNPRAPHGKMVLGISVVAWFDGSDWRVADDTCPHRLAPLSEGRVDHKGRLQCAYHGWCFEGRGTCQFIPQAPALGPPVHKNNKARVATYPCVVQNNILWFYPRTEPEHRDVLQRKQPPYIPEIDKDDPSYFMIYGVRDLPYGCITDLDFGTFIDLLSTVEFDQEGGLPFKMKIEEANIDGFHSNPKEDWGFFKFVAPCTLLGSPFGTVEEPEVRVVFFCVPVAPGKSRCIWASRYKVSGWLDKMMPRWFYHMGSNAILDSDTGLLHVEERNIAAVGLDNWHKACYVPTSSDNLVIAYRNWFRKYCNHQIGWANPTVNQQLLPPPTPTRDQLLERYWSHVMQCTSCSAALKRMRVLEVVLQVASVAVVGFLAVAKGNVVTSVVQRAAVVAVAVLCFAASRWLANFIEKTFYFQDYVHAGK